MRFSGFHFFSLVQIIKRYGFVVYPTNRRPVRTNHLDYSHGFFTGAALFFYVPGFEKSPLTLRVIPPEPTWGIATPLPVKESESETGAKTFYAKDFDTLVDSPVEVITSKLSI